MAEWKRSLVTLWFAVWVTATGMWAMVPFLTYTVEELGVTDPGLRNVWTGVLVAAAPIAAALMGPIWGGLGDRMSRKAMVLRGIFAITVFVGLMTFARTPVELLILRIVQGLFSGYVPPAITLVTLKAPEDSRGSVAAWLTGATHAGAVAGYALGGQLAAAHSSRAVFPVCSALSLLGFLLVFWFVAEDADRPPGPKWRGVRPVLQAVGKDFGYFFQIGPLKRLLVCVALVRFFNSSVNPSFARYVESLGGDPASVGWIFSIEALVLFAATPVWGRVLARVGPRRVFALCAMGIGGSLLAQAQASSVVELQVFRLLSGAVLAGVYPASYAMAAKAADPLRLGSANGAVFMVLAMSHALGASGSGVLVNQLGFRTLMATAGALSVACATFAYRESRRSPAGPVQRVLET